MLENKEIRKLLKHGEMKTFAEFLGMTTEGLRLRLKNQDIKQNLTTQYNLYLKEKVNGKIK